MTKNIFLKKNIINILMISLLIIITFFSFRQYFKENIGDFKIFETLEKRCLIGNDKSACPNFSEKKDIIHYFDYYNPKNALKRLDAITLTSEIVENTYFSIFQLLSPLVIIIMVVGTLNKYYSTGMFKNYLTRMNYKDFLKIEIKTVFKYSFIFPLLLLAVFIISCFVTNFNFSIHSDTKLLAVYNEYKYNNFAIYGLMLFALQYIVSFIYGTIGLICSIKNRNSIVAVVIGYITFLIEYIFVYVALYSFVINNLLGFKGYGEYFNIAGYWFFDSKMNYVLLAFIPLIVLAVNFAYVYKKINNKEEVVIDCEKCIS